MSFPSMSLSNSLPKTGIKWSRLLASILRVLGFTSVFFASKCSRAATENSRGRFRPRRKPLTDSSRSRRRFRSASTATGFERDLLDSRTRCPMNTNS
jgi:hypothetical protein